uniref:Uncharacterized protein n=1 Tax=Lygus hesperus TaxID=30085 RepID=A0A0K8TJ62_LYGHE
MKFLTDEVKYLVIDVRKLGEIDPSLLASLNEQFRSERKHELEEENGYIFLNSEQLPSQKTQGNVLFKDDFINKVGKERYLALKSKNVFQFNKKCRLDATTIKSAQSAEKYFTSYDSISAQDFVRNKVSEKEAEIALQELADQQIIVRRASDECYRLATDFSKIYHFSLTCPVYEPITKSLLHTCFAYRIAFQKIASQINDGVAVSLQLKTKPYLSLFWDLYESKVICPIKVSKGKHSKDSVQNSLSLTFDRDKLALLLNHDECVPYKDTGDLITQLISKKWLKVPVIFEAARAADKCYNTNYLSDYEDPFLEVNKQLKDEWKTLDGKYKTYEKTARKILNDLVVLSEDATVLHVAHCLARLKSNLENLDVPSFGSKTLNDAFPDGDFSNAQELYNFISNGLDEIIVLEEKRYTLQMILNTTLVIFMGICQIAIGAIIDLWSVGAMTHVGNAFISEGISDIIFAIGAIRSGYFSWEDYGNHKIESLLLTIASAGIGAFWSRGTKLSRVGNKLCPPGTMIGELKASQTIGAQVLRNANKSVAKEIVKQICLKTIEGIGFGLANMTVDATIDNFLQGLSDGIASEIMTNVESELKSNRIASVLKIAFEVMGENDARDMISNLTETYFGKTSEWKEFETLAGKIFTCVSRGVSEAAAKKASSGQSTGNFVWVVQRLSQALVWVDRVRHLQEVRGMTSRLLDELSKEIDKQICNKTPVEAQVDSNYERFEHDIIKDLKSQIRARSSQIISNGIVNPLLKEAAHTLFGIAEGKSRTSIEVSKKENTLNVLMSTNANTRRALKRLAMTLKLLKPSLRNTMRIYCLFYPKQEAPNCLLT